VDPGAGPAAHMRSDVRGAPSKCAPRRPQHDHRDQKMISNCSSPRSCWRFGFGPGCGGGPHHLPHVLAHRCRQRSEREVSRCGQRRRASRGPRMLGSVFAEAVPSIRSVIASSPGVLAAIRLREGDRRAVPRPSESNLGRRTGTVRAQRAGARSSPARSWVIVSWTSVAFRCSRDRATTRRPARESAAGGSGAQPRPRARRYV
jgi:hypothetical protein